MAPSANGFLLLDAGLNLIASNDPALQILCFPGEASRIEQPKVSLADRARTTLLDRKQFIHEFAANCYEFLSAASRAPMTAPRSASSTTGARCKYFAWAASAPSGVPAPGVPVTGVREKSSPR